MQFSAANLQTCLNGWESLVMEETKYNSDTVRI